MVPLLVSAAPVARVAPALTTLVPGQVNALFKLTPAVLPTVMLERLLNVSVPLLVTVRADVPEKPIAATAAGLKSSVAPEATETFPLIVTFVSCRGATPAVTVRLSTVKGLPPADV